MWSVRLFKNTGLNTANTVDKPSRLADAQHIDVPALDVLQGEHLNQIKIKATREQVKDVDYLCLSQGNESFYYSVDPFMLTSIDVTTLYITCDSVLTASHIVGDISNVEFSDGVTDRYHVRKSDDTYGAWTEDDPLLIPSKELEYDAGGWDPDTGGEKHLVESTMSLANMAERRDALTYVDGEGGTGSVVVPQTVPALQFTDVIMFDGGRSYKTPSSEYYDHDYERTQNGIARVRSLGAEGCILNSWIVPEAYCNYTPVETEGLEGQITSISGVEGEHNTGVFLDGGTAVRNKRLKYGALNTVELINPASGNKISFLPEDIAESFSNPGQVVLGLFTDPRPAGRPYFYPKFYKGLTLSARGYSQVLPCLQWSNAPLLYTGNSGTAITQIRYNTEANYRNQSATLQTEQILNNQMLSGVSSLVGLGGTANGNFAMLKAPMTPAYTFSQDADLGNVPVAWDMMTQWNLAHKNMQDAYNASYGMAGAAYNALGSAVTGAIGAEISIDMLGKQYAMTAARELQGLMLATQIKVPELAFPKSESLRDFIGNNCYVIKFRPCDADLSKLDKLLDMYGYKISAALDGDMFKTRSKYNYVSAKAVTVSDKRLPLWLRNSLAAQLKAGCRVWHQLPDPTAYEDGSNV